MKPIKAWAVLTQNGKNIAEIFYLAAHDMPMAIYRDKQNRRGGDVQAYQWVHVEIRELERPTRKNQRQAIAKFIPESEDAQLKTAYDAATPGHLRRFAAKGARDGTL